MADVGPQDTSGVDQPSIYVPNLHSDTEYTSAYSQNPDGQLDVMTEIFGLDYRTIAISEIGEEFQEQESYFTMDQEPLEQRLGAASLTPEEVAQRRSTEAEVAAADLRNQTEAAAQQLDMQQDQAEDDAATIRVITQENDETADELRGNVTEAIGEQRDLQEAEGDDEETVAESEIVAVDEQETETPSETASGQQEMPPGTGQIVTVSVAPVEVVQEVDETSEVMESEPVAEEAEEESVEEVNEEPAEEVVEEQAPETAPIEAVPVVVEEEPENTPEVMQQTNQASNQLDEAERAVDQASIVTATTESDEQNAVGELRGRETATSVAEPETEPEEEEVAAPVEGPAPIEEPIEEPAEQDVNAASVDTETSSTDHAEVARVSSSISSSLSNLRGRAEQNQAEAQEEAAAEIEEEQAAQEQERQTEQQLIDSSEAAVAEFRGALAATEDELAESAPEVLQATHDSQNGLLEDQVHIQTGVQTAQLRM